ncbi:hypothetical protein BO70DRAFT_379029 [Aspergillus heteromorphus CBS 117.55]|uniref:DASH complex subunit DAD3 n=1 Tax=Aspergillus heteromorphus CBS 117.55 TaxID=1448321 RepID=A0A317WI99_9EURO|nr:uncharacterized protein BO70DRAFT_379029 [Aspergillus heteromorphus CBS 117.55]PWY84897.1 hypothetical protein BO70DRAFT_379029 [Aspergillus heteromorphus CBS 117.55]
MIRYEPPRVKHPARSTQLNLRPLRLPSAAPNISLLHTTHSTTLTFLPTPQPLLDKQPVNTHSTHTQHTKTETETDRDRDRDQKEKHNVHHSTPQTTTNTNTNTSDSPSATANPLLRASNPLVSDLEQEVLDEYARLLGNVNKLSSTLSTLSGSPTSLTLDGLRHLERKTATVCTLLKASVYSIVLQQQIFNESEEQQQQLLLQEQQEQQYQYQHGMDGDVDMDVDMDGDYSGGAGGAGGAGGGYEGGYGGGGDECF